MDALDIRIVRLLRWRPGDPADAGRTLLGPWDVARELDVHGTTVKRRLERLRDKGILAGIVLAPAPSVLGLRRARYRYVFEDEVSKDRGVKHLIDYPYSMDSITLVGNEAWFTMTAPDHMDLDAKAREAGALAGATEVHLLERREWDADAGAVDRLDLRIMRALTPDAFRPVSEVAEAVGVTPRTVRNRLNALVEARAFLIMPYLIHERIEGLIPFVLHTTVDDPGDPSVHTRLLNAIPEGYLPSFPGATTPYVVAATRNSAAVEDVVLRARSLPGVASARTLLIRSTTGCHQEGRPTPVDVAFEERGVPAES